MAPRTLPLLHDHGPVHVPLSARWIERCLERGTLHADAVLTRSGAEAEALVHALFLLALDAGPSPGRDTIARFARTLLRQRLERHPLPVVQRYARTPDA
ncbi:MAG: hypothetical protein ACU85V_02365 [Gammaproteobacteria bacterium]